MRNAFLLFTIGLSSLTLRAQTAPKTLRYQQQTWLMYQLQLRFSPHWGGILESHLRRSGHFVDFAGTQINRVGLSYFPNAAARLSANYAYVVNRNAFNVGPARPEHRTWAEIGFSQPFPRLVLNQRFRAEQRFVHRSDGNKLTEGYRFNHRLRYQLGIQWPMRPPAPGRLTPNLVVQNEILVNAGKEIVYNYFDQNQFFIGISCPVGRGFTLQTGYLNLFQQQSAGNAFVDFHILRFTVFQTLDLQRRLPKTNKVAMATLSDLTE